MDSILYISGKVEGNLATRKFADIIYEGSIKENENHVSPPGSMHLFMVTLVNVPLSWQVMLYEERSALSSKKKPFLKIKKRVMRVF